MESFSRTAWLAYSKNMSWIKVLVMLFQLLKLLEVNPLAPKDTNIVSHSTRFKVTTQVWPNMVILEQSYWVFFPATTNLLIMSGFNRVGWNVVHSGCPILAHLFASPNHSKISLHFYCTDCQLPCLVNRDSLVQYQHDMEWSLYYF